MGWTMLLTGWTMLLSVYAVPLLIYLLFAVPALYTLRRREIDDTAQAVWALAIIAVPVMGAVAFAMLRPGTADS